jgi:hypothetical protein
MGSEVGSGVTGVLAKEEQAGVDTVEAVAETVACRLMVLMSRIPQGTLRLTSGNALALRNHTLHSSVLELAVVVVPAVATVTVTGMGSVIIR